MEYQLNESIDVIFTAVEDLQELAELAGRPFTPQQIVDIGYLIVLKHRIFRSDIRKWLRRVAVDQTWPEFKIFSQKSIKNSGTQIPQSTSSASTLPTSLSSKSFANSDKRRRSKIRHQPVTFPPPIPTLDNPTTTESPHVAAATTSLPSIRWL